MTFGSFGEKKGFRNFSTLLKMVCGWIEMFFVFLQELCGPFYLESNPDPCWIEIFDRNNRLEHGIIRRSSSDATFGLQDDSVSDFSPQA